LYTIIGGDGREYGPVSTEQLRQWVQEGRANAQTRVRADGATEWATLGALPEFTDLFTTTAGTTVLAPPPAIVEPKAWAAEVLTRDYDFRVGDCLSRGWQLVKSDFWLLVGASFVATIITSGGGIPYLGALIGLVVGGPMMGGLYILFLRKIRGGNVSFGDAFIGFSAAFVPLMLTYVVSSLLTGLGLLLCLLPGIYLGVSWVFALPLVLDKKMEFWDAMELSRKMVGKHWWLMFGFLIVLALVAISGAIACCVGIFVTIAIAQAALMYAYEEIFGSRPTSTGNQLAESPRDT
jgi:hypothetical protein